MHSGHAVGEGQLARQDGMALRTPEELRTESSSIEETEPTVRNKSAKAVGTPGITTKVVEASETSIWNALYLESIGERMSCQSK